MHWAGLILMPRHDSNTTHEHELLPPTIKNEVEASFIDQTNEQTKYT
jgi:hypothetical protein